MKTTTTKTTKRWIEHDHVTDWQECRWCELRVGAGTHTKWDATYYDPDWDPSDCPRCGQEDSMGLVVEEVA